MYQGSLSKVNRDFVLNIFFLHFYFKNILARIEIKLIFKNLSLIIFTDV